MDRFRQRIVHTKCNETRTITFTFTRGNRPNKLVDSDLTPLLSVVYTDSESLIYCLWVFRLLR
ncbi:hypothetical protein FGIG_11481 [Fasciola gigantica]|uniref:Uncharacterized protein n=1 Tax=Fasciola gigantica TaxID=46835 RepID=A0A504ZD89_FASGI|nr:hypothetical protein FGIG_11481 [Fasciola gigantica]